MDERSQVSVTNRNPTGQIESLTGLELVRVESNHRRNPSKNENKYKFNVRQAEKTTYLTAKGHIQVERPKKRQEMVHSRIQELISTQESDGTPSTSRRQQKTIFANRVGIQLEVTNDDVSTNTDVETIELPSNKPSILEEGTQMETKRKSPPSVFNC